jgi:thiol:disulfide interchange protein DsbC
MKHGYALLLAALLPLGACAQGKNQGTTTPVAPAPAAATAVVDKSDPRVALAAKIPGAKPEDLRATPVPGIYELTHGADISYISADAKFLFAGDMYRIADNGDFPNLSENRRRELRLKVLGDVPESQMLVFGAANAPHTITVFTDIDCPWCRKLHSQIAGYNRLGIRVRYLFYPRSGPDTESWAKADAVWCSADRKAALTRAKLGQATPAPHCANTPVGRQYNLGHELGVDSTPSLILETGELIPGYLTPQQLLAHLQSAKPVGAAPASAAN